MTDAEAQAYIVHMKQDRTFGEGIALSAAAKLYGKRIVIFSPEGVQHIDLPQTDILGGPEEHIYLGLFNEHYVSVRPSRMDNNIESHSQQQSVQNFIAGPMHVVIDDTECKSNSNLVTTSTSYIDNIVVEYDIGIYLNGEIDDFTKCQILENHWEPTSKFNFPFSIHKKGGR